MILEDKVLLLKDLCGRLPYGTNVRAFIGEKIENDEILGCVHIFYFYSHNCKPYLRPMSSMTEEEIEEYKKLCRTQTISLPLEMHTRWYDTWESIDWLNKHHFDYRGLIEKGLALKAPEDMYK